MNGRFAVATGDIIAADTCHPSEKPEYAISSRCRSIEPEAAARLSYPEAYQ
ncbi:hypothetical protein [Muribaculum intestinale]|uniref:hypothetical protein n=1 Tax=Muribaculum intestinale TaxID=1796646 RepID=UPI0026DF7801|nr:hypothetical protein [Muribaculum intestinale]